MAASSFEMKVCDPRPLLNSLELGKLGEIIGYSNKNLSIGNGLSYIEPGGRCANTGEQEIVQETNQREKGNSFLAKPQASEIRRGKIQRLGDFVDTDAVSTRGKSFRYAHLIKV